MSNWLSKGQKSAPPILDTGYLERLANHIGERETRELIADGMLELTENLDRIRRLTERGSVEEIGKLAHQIAGSAGHQGLSAMSIAAVEAARMARETPTIAAVDLADMILAHRDEALKALAEYCRREQSS